MLLRGDCVLRMAELPDNSIDAVVSDPPYGLSFMGNDWDTLIGEIEDEGGSQSGREMEAWHEQWLAQCFRVLKPGGVIFAFSGSRTVHRLTAAMETVGFTIHDMAYWTYATGFPKNLDIAKAIDKKRYDLEQIYEVTAWIREARDNAGISNAEIDKQLGYTGMASHWTSLASQPAVPTIDQVPMLLSVLGVEEEDVPEHIRTLLYELNGRKGQPGEAWFRREVTGQHDAPSAGATWRVTYGLADEAVSKERRDKPATPEAEKWQGWGTALKPSHEPIVVASKGHVDFTYLPNIIYCPKPNRAERNVGLEGLPLVEWIDGAAVPNRAIRPNQPNANFHPTVKPITLMRTLVSLASSRGETVLDPFLGSGTTAVAATLEKREWIGCEMTEDYWQIIEARTQWASAELANAHPTLFEL